MAHGIPHAVLVGNRLWRVRWGLPKRQHDYCDWQPKQTLGSTIHETRQIILNPRLRSNRVQAWVTFVHELDHASDTEKLCNNPRTQHRHTKSAERIGEIMARGGARMNCVCQPCMVRAIRKKK